MKKVVHLIALSACCTLCACSTPEKKPMDKAQQPTGVTKPMSIQTFASGLKKEILTTAPNGAASPTARQKVAVHYTGWLEKDGQPDLNAKFDSSVDRGAPFVFNVGAGQVIQGWDEGVMTMKVGEKARFTLPSSIAYGSRGAGRMIPPNATLVFDVELLSVG